MDISVQPTETWIAEDRSWLASRDGTDVTQSITLDTSTFTKATHYPNGYVRSGTVLGRITATGLYGPYSNAASDGREVAAGFLYTSTVMVEGGANVGAPLHWRGAIKESRLPTNHGLDSNAKTDLAAKWLFR